MSALTTTGLQRHERPGGRLVFAALGLLVLSASEAAGQVSSDPIAQGVREPTSIIVDQIGVAGFAAGQISSSWLLVPSFIAAEGQERYGATVGVKVGGLIPGLTLQLRGVARHLDLEPDDRTAFGGDIKISRSGAGIVSASAKASLVETADVVRRAEGELSVDVEVASPGIHSIKVGGTARLRSNRPSGGSSQSGEVFAVGGSWGLGTDTELLGGYQFDNDFVDEDYSFTISQLLPGLPQTSVLIVTVAKSRVLALNLALVF